MNDVFPGAPKAAPVILSWPHEKVFYSPNRAGRRAAERGLRLAFKKARKFARVVQGRQRRG